MELDLGPAFRLNLSSSVLQQLVDVIAQGQLQPGDPLPSERELCLRMGVGRSSVREAIRGLASMNLVRTSQGKATVVAQPLFSAMPIDQRVLALAVGSLKDFYELRAILEIEAAGLAAERATQEDIEAIRQSMDMLLESKDRTAAFDSNAHFHIAVARASHNPLLANSVYNAVGMHRYLRESLTDQFPGMREQDVVDHREIFDAIRNADPTAAREVARRHILLAKEAVAAPIAADLLRDALIRYEQNSKRGAEERSARAER